MVHVASYTNETVRTLPPDWPPGIRVLSGPQVTGRSEGELAVSFRLLVRTPGRYTVPPLVLRVGQQGVTTRAVSFEVRPAVAQRDIKPRLFWEVLTPEPWFIGQTVGLQLTLESFGELLIPGELTVRPPQGGQLQEGSFNTRLRGGSDGAQDGSQRLLTPVAVYALQLVEPIILLPPARVVADGLQLFSEQLRLAAEAPPESVLPGALGTFDLEVSAPPMPLQIGVPFHVTIRLSGVGSLSGMQLPAAQHPGLEFLDSTQRVDLRLSEVGYVGTVATELQLVATEPGSYSISIPGFAYFDPLRGAVGQVPLRVAQVAVEATSGSGVGAPAGALPAFQEPRPGSCVRLHQVPAAYLMFLPGPLACLAVVLSRWGKRRRRLLVLSLVIGSATAVGGQADGTLAALYAAGDYFAVQESLSAIRAQQTGCWRLLAYAEGLVFYQLGQSDRAVQHLRVAVADNPRDSDARLALQAVEAKLALDAQPPPQPAASPGFLLVAMIASAAVSGTALALFLAGRNAALLVAATLAAMSLVGFGGWFGATLARQARPQVVVRIDADALQRIPEPLASQWFELPPGSALTVLESFGDYLLVETGYRLMGWVSANSVLPVSVPGR